MLLQRARPPPAGTAFGERCVVLPPLMGAVVPRRRSPHRRPMRPAFQPHPTPCDPFYHRTRAHWLRTVATPSAPHSPVSATVTTTPRPHTPTHARIPSLFHVMPPSPASHPYIRTTQQFASAMKCFSRICMQALHATEESRRSNETHNRPGQSKPCKCWCIVVHTFSAFWL